MIWIPISNESIPLLYIKSSLSAFLLTSMLFSAAAMADRKPTTASITAEQWELAREGARVAAIPQLGSVVRSWSSASDKLIEIQYPGGEEGEIWVNEIKSWLVSLGVASRYLMTVPGSGQADVIRFQLINNGDSFSE